MSVDLKALKKAYGTDLEKEVSGVWFSLSSIDGARVKMAKAGNPKYEKLLRKLYKPHSRLLRKGKDLAKSVQEEISTTLLVETLLLDWEGFPDANGNDVPYSKGEARALLNDPELKEFKEEVQGFAEESGEFALEMDEELQGNSENT
ncbi:MAG TPA: hypothetical protein VKN82_08875 [Desulfohalobiaceae bacterium]|nr:hypothetical protein [Desulfohalobiaceae bacterium]